VSAGPDVGARLADVRGRIEAAARRAGRDPAGVTLVGASKTVPAARVAEAVAAGLADVGENRAQELLAKAGEVGTPGGAPRWHFLGPLQRNKVRALAPWVVLWQTVDRVALGRTIAQHAPGSRVLVEVNLGGEPQKAGCEPGQAGQLVDELRDLGLTVEGLMAIPPAGGDPRRWFAALRDLAGGIGVAELSMGMTADYEAAVEEGATIVRVGRALFGERS